jgi:hypothetical protein
MSKDDLIEVHRVDQTGRVRRALLTGASILTVGALVVAISFLTRQPERVRQIAAVIGLVFTVAGALTTVIRMHAALRDDAYLAVRDDGILIQSRIAAPPTFLPWSELTRIHCDADALVFERESGAPLRTAEHFGDGGPGAMQALAKRLDEMRRRAAFSLRLH